MKIIAYVDILKFLAKYLKNEISKKHLVVQA
jgi:hypothetical protein